MARRKKNVVSSLEQMPEIIKLIVNNWNKRDAASYIRGLRMFGKDDPREIKEELKFLEIIARVRNE